MNKNRGLGGSWGCVGRVLEPSGPKGPPRCTLSNKKIEQMGPHFSESELPCRSNCYFKVLTKSEKKRKSIGHVEKAAGMQVKRCF